MKRPFWYRVPNIFKLKRNTENVLKTRNVASQASSRLKELENKERTNAKALKTLKQETNTPAFL